MKYEEKNDQIKFNLNVYEVFFTNCVYLKNKKMLILDEKRLFTKLLAQKRS